MNRISMSGPLCCPDFRFKSAARSEPAQPVPVAPQSSAWVANCGQPIAFDFFDYQKLPRFDSTVAQSGELYTSHTASEKQEPAYRQWPWRGFAFCSDLGSIGYLLKNPRLARWGWALALPYYAYALIHQPSRAKRQEELIYQATANGVFPFLAAKGGVQAGQAVHQAVSSHWKEVLLKHGLSAPRFQLVGALLALLLLTPGVGDPLSRWLLTRYQEHLTPDAGILDSDSRL